MTISSSSCVVVTCSRCGDNQHSDHYASLEDARQGHLGAAGDVEAWRWDDRDPVCPACLQREREQACDHHDWELDPPRDGSWGSLQRRECSLCHAVDLTRDQGRTWLAEARIATDATITELELQFDPFADALTHLLHADPKGVLNVQCCAATCDGCGADFGESEWCFTVHFPSEAALVDGCIAAGWQASSRTGKVTCDACQADLDEEECQLPAPVHIEGQMTLSPWSDQARPEAQR